MGNILLVKGGTVIKIQNKLPKVKEQLHLDLINDGWVPMKEPKKLSSAILISIPIMFINALISIVIINMFSTISLNEFGITSSLSINIDLGVIIWVFLLIIFHELIHLLFIPNFLKSRKTMIGFTLFGCYVHTEEELSKSRYILVTIAPFIILSIILPLILGVFGLLSSTFKSLVLLNSMASSLDILMLILLLTQIPKKASLRNNGTKTYWKIDLSS
jgi:hypothetical protein